MAIQKELFGYKDGKDVYLYRLSNSSNTIVEILTLGGIIKSVFTNDKNGKSADIVTGFDTVDGYVKTGGYPGAIIGRVCNRISAGTFELNGVRYQIYQNEGNNTLHGGKEGFNLKVWDCIKDEDSNEPSITLNYLSPDGDENFPGNLNVFVEYVLETDGGLKISYKATTDKETPVSLTNHSYFNLSGYDSGVIDHNILWVDSDEITEVDADLLPTGKFIAVKGTPFDFNVPKCVGDEFNSKDEMIVNNKGIDNNFMIKNYTGEVKKVACLYDPKSGRKIEVYSDQPCLQVYTSNMINVDDVPFKNNVKQYVHCAVCLETQKMSDAVNHKDFINVFLKPGETYTHNTIYKFS